MRITMIDGSIGYVVPARASPCRALEWSIIRAQVLERDHHQCQDCGAVAPEVVLHCHHKTPRYRGGTDALSNLITLCEDCHAACHPWMRP